MSEKTKAEKGSITFRPSEDVLETIMRSFADKDGNLPRGLMTQIMNEILRAYLPQYLREKEALYTRAVGVASQTLETCKEGEAQANFDERSPIVESGFESAAQKVQSGRRKSQGSQLK